MHGIAARRALVRDIEDSYLQLESSDESAINDLISHSITYRIAVNPQAGRKAFTLQTMPALEEDSENSKLAKTAGFSLHAGAWFNYPALSRAAEGGRLGIGRLRKAAPWQRRVRLWIGHR